MAGASGFLGTRLADRLTADGHQITRLVRRAPRGAGEIGVAPLHRPARPGRGRRRRRGDQPGRRRASATSAGPSDYRRLIRSSRVDSTTTLATAIAGLPAADRPQVLLNASAVGWYGDTGDRAVEEDAPAGEGFLADVCRVWEAATRPAEDAGVRVVRLRTGLPLHRDGGMLKPQLLPFKLGVAGRLGSGRQWMPWISMADWLDGDGRSCSTATTSPARSTWSVRTRSPTPSSPGSSARPAPPGDDPDPRRGAAGGARRLRRRGADQHPGPARRAAAGPASPSGTPTWPAALRPPWPGDPRSRPDGPPASGPSRLRGPITDSDAGSEPSSPSGRGAGW